MLCYSSGTDNKPQYYSVHMYCVFSHLSVVLVRLCYIQNTRRSLIFVAVRVSVSQSFSASQENTFLRYHSIH